jgi:8-oxo-dGTP diphosphatase
MSVTYDYPRPAVTVDSIVFCLLENDLKVLLIKRKNDPFQGCYSFPGGFMEIDESPELAVQRELKEETGLAIDDYIQVGAFAAPDRDPRHRTVSIAYLSVITEEKKVVGQDDAAKACWCSLSDMPYELAFDHSDMLEQVKVFADMYFRTAIPNSAEAFFLNEDQIEELLNYVA